MEQIGKGVSASTESLRYSLLTGTGALPLIFEDPQDADKIPPGSLIEVTGCRTGKQFTVPADSDGNASIASQSPSKPERHIRMTSAAPAPKTLGQRKVAVLVVNFQNDQRQLVDAATATSVVFGDANTFYQEASYGNLSIVGGMSDVYGYYTLPIDSVCDQVVDMLSVTAGFTTIQDAATTAAQDGGVDLSGYDTVMIVADELQSCTGGEAAATIGGTPGYVIVKTVASVYATVTSHEIGHNLGLHHARFLDCGNVPYTANASNVCSYVEHGDFDVMGMSSLEPFHFNAAFKESLGWLQPQPIATSGNYEIACYELGSGTKALKIEPPQANDTFYIEYRQPVGYDSQIGLYVDNSNPGINGPFVHLGGNPSYLLNMNPLDVHEYPAPTLEPYMPGLSPAQTYVDYANRFSATTVSTDPTAAQFRILIPGASSPTLMFILPTDGATVSGTVDISIDALDLSGISKVDLSLDGSPLTSWTAAPYTYDWNTLTAAPGQHQIKAVAYNTQGNSYSQQIAVTVPAQQIGGLTNGASFAQAVAPGSIVSLFIDGFSLPTAPAAAIPLPTSLGGISAIIGSESLPFYYVSSTQLNVQLPGTFPRAPTLSP